MWMNLEKYIVCGLGMRVEQDIDVKLERIDTSSAREGAALQRDYLVPYILFVFFLLAHLLLLVMNIRYLKK